jgi:non-homologous end joining protein Ku
MEQTYFVRPSPLEENANGISAFARLRESMIRKNVVLVGELLSRPGGTSRLVALSPWIPLSDVISQLPAGMVANFLPFQEEIRDTALASLANRMEPLVPDDLRRLVTKLIEKLTYDVDDPPSIGQDFKNAQMDKLCHYITQVALCEAASVEEEDEKYDTVLSECALGERSVRHRSLIASIMAALPEEDAETEKLPAPKASRKRAREFTGEPGSDWKSLYEDVDGDLSKWNVSMLKAYCKEMGMSQEGRKAELMSLVKPHIETLIDSGSS